MENVQKKISLILGGNSSVSMGCQGSLQDPRVFDRVGNQFFVEGQNRVTVASFFVYVFVSLYIYQSNLLSVSQYLQMIPFGRLDPISEERSICMAAKSHAVMNYKSGVPIYGFPMKAR